MGKTKAELGLCAVRGCRKKAVIVLGGEVKKVKGGYRWIKGTGILLCGRKGHGHEWIKAADQ